MFTETIKLTQQRIAELEAQVRKLKDELRTLEMLQEINDVEPKQETPRD